MKRSIALILCLLMLVMSMPLDIMAIGNKENNKNNDISGHWAERYIRWCMDNNYFKGYPDGSFKPNGNITNAEYISVMSNLLKEEYESKINYDDVKSSDWFYTDLRNIVSFNVLNNYGNFEPEKPITRDDAFRILAALYRQSADESSLTRFKDYLEIESKSEIAALVNIGVVTGDDEGKINPNANITRAEVCAILKRIVEILGNDILKYQQVDINGQKEKSVKKAETEDKNKFKNNKSGKHTNSRDHKIGSEDKRNGYNISDPIVPSEPSIPDQPDQPDQPDKPAQPREDDLVVAEEDMNLAKLKELIKKHNDEVVKQARFIFASDKTKTPYVEAIEKGKLLVDVENPNDADIKDVIKEIVRTYNALDGVKPSEPMNEEKADAIIKQKADKQKEKEDVLFLNSKLNNSKIIIDDIDSDYSFVTFDDNKHVKGRVVTEKKITKVGAYIVDVTKENNIEAEVLVQGHEFEFNLTNIDIGSNKVNVYAMLEDGELVEKTFFVERYSKEIEISEDVIYATDEAGQDSTDDIEGLYSAEGVNEVLAIEKGSSIANQIESGVKSLIINLGTYEVKHIIREITQEEALQLTNNKASAGSNLLYYEVKNGNLGDLVSGNVNIFASDFEPTEDILIDYDMGGLEKYMEMQEIQQATRPMMMSANKKIEDEIEYEKSFKKVDDKEVIKSVISDGAEYTLEGKKLTASLSAKDKENKDNNIGVGLEARILSLPPTNETLTQKFFKTAVKLTELYYKIHSRYIIFDIVDKLYNGFSKEHKTWNALKIGFSGNFKASSSNINDKVKIKSDGLYSHYKQYELKTEAAIQTARKKGAKEYNLAELKMVYGSLAYGSLETIKKQLGLQITGDITGLIKDGMVRKSNKKVDKRHHDIGNPSYKSSGEPFYLGSIIFKIKPGEHFRVTGSKNGELVNLNLRDFICLRASMYVAADGRIEIRYSEESEETYSVAMSMLIADDKFENEAKHHKELSVYQNIYKKKDSVKVYPISSSYKLYVNNYKEHSKTTKITKEAVINIGIDVGSQFDFVLFGFTPFVIDIGVNNNLLFAGRYINKKFTFSKNGEAAENENTVKEGEMHYKATLYGDLYYEFLDFSNKPGKDKLLKTTAENAKKQTKALKELVNEINQELVKILEINNTIMAASEDPNDIRRIVYCIDDIIIKTKTLDKYINSDIIKFAVKDMMKTSKKLLEIEEGQYENTDSSAEEIETLIEQINTIKETIEKVAECVDSKVDLIYRPINIFSPTVIAEIDFINYNSVFIFDKKTQTITGYRGKKYVDIEIPAKINGVEVLRIGDAAFKDANITSLKFEKNSKIKNIGSNAFANNSSMKFDLSKLPETVEVIGAYAFSGAGFKGELKIPTTLKRIDTGAFMDNGITTVKLPYLEKGYATHIFNYNPIEEITFADDFKVVTNNMFASCGFGSKIKLGESKIEEIEDGAFFNADIEGELKLPKTIKKIGRVAFSNNKITAVELPESLEKVGDQAFGDNNIKKINIIGIKYGYGMAVFYNNSIEEVTFAPNFKKVDQAMFKNCKFANAINIEDSSIEEVCNSGFNNAGFVGELKLPKTMKKLGTNAFSFNKITNFEIPSSMEEIDDDAFNFNPIEKITFSEDIKIIPEGMFLRGFEFSNKLDFESSKIERIEKDAFVDCKFEGVLRFPNTLNYIEDEAFGISFYTSFYDVTKIYLPAGCSYSYDSFGIYSESDEEKNKIIGGVNRSKKKEEPGKPAPVEENSIDDNELDIAS